MKHFSQNGQENRMGQEQDRAEISCISANALGEVLQERNWDNAEKEQHDGLNNSEGNEKEILINLKNKECYSD
jgi:hypothetical protein